MATVPAVVLAIAGIILIRAGWGGRRALAYGGWAAIAVAIIVLMSDDGAWGIAVGATAAMLAALGIVLREAMRSPVGRAVPPRAPASVVLPRRVLGVGRRLLVFVLVVPVGVAAAYVFALGLEAAAMRAGWHPADRTALAFFAAPIAWTVLTSVQMIQSGPVRMIQAPALCAALGLLLWWPL